MLNQIIELPGVFDVINSLVSYQSGRSRERIVLGLRKAGQDIDMVPPIVCAGHHLAQVATAFYCSGLSLEPGCMYCA